MNDTDRLREARRLLNEYAAEHKTAKAPAYETKDMPVKGTMWLGVGIPRDTKTTSQAEAEQERKADRVWDPTDTFRRLETKKVIANVGKVYR